MFWGAEASRCGQPSELCGCKNILGCNFFSGLRLGENCILVK